MYAILTILVCPHIIFKCSIFTHLSLLLCSKICKHFKWHLVDILYKCSKFTFGGSVTLKISVCMSLIKKFIKMSLPMHTKQSFNKINFFVNQYWEHVTGYCFSIYLLGGVQIFSHQFGRGVGK